MNNYPVNVVVFAVNFCRFYSHNSSFMHSGMDPIGNEQSVVVGQAVSTFASTKAMFRLSILNRNWFRIFWHLHSIC